MFCHNCGKKLEDGALFCDECGTKIEKPLNVQESPKIEEEQQIRKNTSNKEGHLHKCPNCGELLNFDDIKCPSCGYEIRDRGTTVSVQSFFNKISSTDDLDKKIELIKTFPIPNTREDVIEFMLLAESNFDAKFYATNKDIDSLSSAWLSKIDQCYTKANILLSDKKDLDKVEEIYSRIYKNTKKIRTYKLLMIIGGFIAILVSLICIVSFNVTNNTALSLIFIALLAAGIILLVLGFKKKKTNKQIEEEKAAKASKGNRG